MNTDNDISRLQGTAGVSIACAQAANAANQKNKTNANDPMRVECTFAGPGVAMPGEAPNVPAANTTATPKSRRARQQQPEPDFAMGGMPPMGADFGGMGMPMGAQFPMMPMGAMPGMGMPAMPGMPGMMFPGMPGMGMPGMMFPGMPGMPYPGTSFPPGPPMQSSQRGGGGKGGGRGAGRGAGKGGALDANAQKNRRKTKGKSTDKDPAGDSNDTDISTKNSALQKVIRAGKDQKGLMLDMNELLAQEKPGIPNILEFAKDPNGGSKWLTERLEKETDQQYKQAMIESLMDKAPDLSMDQHGNHVIQKIFEVGTPEQKKDLAKALLPMVVELSKHQHGCRVVQKAIQTVPRESQLQIAECLKPQEVVTQCIENLHGNHVIQKCIEQLPPDSVSFIISAVDEYDITKMTMNIYGCRVVQRLLEHCQAAQLQVMLEKILGSVQKLAQDQYGNYVVQHMLEHGQLQHKKQIIKTVTDNVVEFAKHKCSSNVVEKCLEVSTTGEHAKDLEKERASLMQAVMHGRHGEEPPIHKMMEDRYGNYIVQRMIEHSRGQERQELKNIIDSMKEKLKGSTIGKHIYEASQKEFTVS